MTKTIRIFLLICLIQPNLYSQGSATTDALALQMPLASTYATSNMIDYLKQNFSTDSARIRAIYVWITNNIRYDIAKFRARETNTEGVKRPVEDVLKTRNAVCQGYAELFVELCIGVGVNASFVGGYTKKDGMVSSIPHAWAAAELNGNWYLFDPTWGAGYVRNDQFVQAFNNRFYKVTPAEMIQDHMPFDPMYQFLNHIITNQEFIEGQTADNHSKPFFNYSDTLKQYALLSLEEQVQGEMRRLEANGVRNDLILSRLNFLKNRIQAHASKDNFTEASRANKLAIELFNQYIDHKNHQFSTIEDNTLQQLIDSISNYTNSSRSLLNTITPRNEAQRQTLAGYYQNLERFQKRVLEEKEFVTRYLSTDKTSRRQLFGRQ